jgi:hypothetical protein
MVCWDDEDDVLEAASAIDEQEGAQHTVERAELHEAQRERTASTAGYISDILFLFGSILYVLIAVWDYQSADERSNDDDGGHSFLLLAPGEHETDDDRMEIELPNFTVAISPYTVISASGAVMYIFCAIFQLKQLTNSCGNSNHHLLHKLRHIPLLETSTGLAFGVGAMLDISCTMAESLEDPSISRYFGVSSSYMYLLNACLIFFGKEYCFETVADGIESFGDILFLTGSIIDVLSIYLLAGRDADELAIGNLVFTSIWLLDAIIYILGDLYCCYCEDNDDDSEGEDDIDDAISIALYSAASDTQSLGGVTNFSKRRKKMHKWSSCKICAREESRRGTFLRLKLL